MSCYCFLNNLIKGIPISDKYALVISARVHPGESNSSWMMLGLMQQLIGLDSDAEELRRRFFICLVPMLNPDGVILGNYRCSLSGRDMNRNYRRPRKEVFPTVWHIRQLVQSCKNACQDVIYCDLHGHSRQNNVFMYGCDPTYGQSRTPGLLQRGTYETSLYCLRERLLPYLLAKQVIWATKAPISNDVFVPGLM
ncbi:Cytosolic carboxypeptidase 2 [Fasciolopsis buskii]|uniref:Cytosolic carboxypeptidase 2 n=1 Tax=Fasciolopsis buskii TaxID=27845 RepID=A0A8E0VPZ9_9TREM|nr:Cytosolic carboxypeptidase 2 [Fasciolopsis buski]